MYMISMPCNSVDKTLHYSSLLPHVFMQQNFDHLNGISCKFSVFNLFACKQIYVHTPFLLHSEGNDFKISSVCFKIKSLMTNQSIFSTVKRNVFF